MCQHTVQQQFKHRSRISAPFLDRIDIHIEAPRITNEELNNDTSQSENSQQIRQRVYQAYQRQQKRGPRSNAELRTKEIETSCLLKTQEKLLLDKAMEKLKLSARAYHRTLKLARTIADIENSDDIEMPHLTEAISYRAMNRFNSNT